MSATGSSAAAPGAEPSSSARAQVARSAAVVTVEDPAGAMAGPVQKGAGQPFSWWGRAVPAGTWAGCSTTTVRVIPSGASSRSRTRSGQPGASAARASACPSSATPRLE